MIVSPGQTPPPNHVEGAGWVMTVCLAAHFVFLLYFIFVQHLNFVHLGYLKSFLVIFLGFFGIYDTIFNMSVIIILFTALFIHKFYFYIG